MKDLIKQRLVGALILLALGVVFWPIIFAPPATKAPVSRIPIPDEPVIDTRPLPQPTADNLRQPQAVVASSDDEPASPPPRRREPQSAAKDQSEASTPAVAQKVRKGTDNQRKTRDKPPTKPKLDGQGLPVAWMLQVVSVSSQEKAKALRSEILEMELRAYIKTVKVNGKSLYRVYIGPKYEQAALEQIKPRIDARFGVNSMIKRYIP